MILKISEWLAYIPLICFLDSILFGKRNAETKISGRILKAAGLVAFVLIAGSLLVNLLELWIDVKKISELHKALRWNIYNIILFLIFMAVKIRNNGKEQPKLFGISIISCMFAVIQIIFYYYLFLANPAGLTQDNIGMITLCSMAILFIQGAILELMERNIRVQSKQNEDEKKLLEQKYEKNYYQLTMEQKQAVVELHGEMKQQLLRVEELIEHSTPEKEQEVQNLLSELEEKVGKVGKVAFCKDPVMNTILALKYARADKEGLSMNICVEYYMRTQLEEFDMCSIIANLLDNAIEATIGVRDAGIEFLPIDVHVGSRGGYLILKIQNSMKESLKKNRKGQFISSKKEIGKSRNHGRGIAIIETALNKCEGYLRFEEQEGKMTVMAFVPLKEKQ